ncbi:hypothetical protein [Arthrobacter sp. NPDC089319]|uniref:hypothetical protein n=1 Tax=Arthrobacter sp. NPDC089319 TaxID=3155915 RepID=UPI003428C840
MRRFIQGGWFFLALGLVLQLSRNVRIEGFVWQNVGAVVLLVVGVLLFLWHRPSPTVDTDEPAHS